MWRTRILIAILVVLVVVAGVFVYRQQKFKELHEAHWAKMADRAIHYTVANGGPGRGLGLTAEDVAAPVAESLPGPPIAINKRELPWTDGHAANGVLTRFDGCLPAGDDRDVIWQAADLYLATAPDKLKRVWTANLADGQFGREQSYVCFDGRYLWAPLNRARGLPQLIVVDPQSEQVWEYTDPDGSLPGVTIQTSSTVHECRLAVAPVSPGKICAVARWWVPESQAGTDQPSGAPMSRGGVVRGEIKFWMGTFEFDPPQQRAAVQFAVDSSIAMAAGPVEMTTLGRGSTMRIIVGRGGDLPQLIIDPEARRVSLAPSAPAQGMGTSPLSSGRFAIHDGAFWWMMNVSSLQVATGLAAGFQGMPMLVTCGLPSLKEHVVLRQVPVGLLVSNGSDLHIIGDRCWRLRGTGPRLQELAGEPPWQFVDYAHRGLNSGGASGGNIVGIRDFMFMRTAAPVRGDLDGLRLVARSAVFGLLVSVTSAPGSAETHETMYELTIPTGSSEQASPAPANE
ncbi:MAG TPA: hypothetical protein VF306_13550 [Pirellulales bacterium]